MSDKAQTNGLQDVRRQDEYERLRKKWTDMLTGGTGFDPFIPEFAGIIARITEAADSCWAALRKSEDRACLWDDLEDWSHTATITSNYTRIWQMALACHTYGSALYRHPDLERDVVNALEWMYSSRYNPGVTPYGNWWDWQIGAPLRLLDCVTLLYDRLSERQRNDYLGVIDRFKPDVPPSSTGANRVWECTILAVRGVVGKDSGKIAAARDEVHPVFSYATEGDGFYRDGSYIQHGTYAYTGGYGQSLLQDLANVMVLLDGSSWEVEDAGRRNVFRWIYDSYEPLMYKGSMMDMSMGRVISRRDSQNHDVGHIIARSVLRLSQIAPDSDAIVFQSMVKQWIRADTWLSFYSDACLSSAISAKRIANDASIPLRGELCLHKSFANMARSVHHRPGYAFAVSMHSERISNYESINNENLRGWHTSDGMTYLYNGDLAQYCDAFWPTVNAFRLPGTTVLQGTETAANRLSDQQWAGGTELLGTYGTAGMSLHPPGQSLCANKSWFMFDEEIAALGSDICSQEGAMAETVIDNRMLNRSGSNRLTVNGDNKSDGTGWTEQMEGVVWMHLQGNAEQSDIGYYFPEPATIKGLRESRSGTWRSINLFERDCPVMTRNFLGLWMEHGVDPVEASYAYVLLPNKSAVDMKHYAEAPNIVVLANTCEVHAVRHRLLNVTAVNYWVDGGTEIGGIRVDSQSSVMMMEHEGRLAVAVSDPTFRQEGTIHIEIGLEAEGVLSQDPAVTVLGLRPAIRMSVDVSRAYGKTFQCCFAVPSGA
jgi:hyaluronate lyase